MYSLQKKTLLEEEAAMFRIILLMHNDFLEMQIIPLMMGISIERVWRRFPLTQLSNLLNSMFPVPNLHVRKNYKRLSDHVNNKNLRYLIHA